VTEYPPVVKCFALAVSRIGKRLSACEAFISFQIAARHHHYQILPPLHGVGLSAVPEMMLFL